MRTLGVLTLVGTLVLASLAVMPLTTAPSAAAVGFDDSWDYTNYRGTPLPFLDANGTVEIRQSNTASDFTGSYFDSLLRGSFPWGVTTGTALPSGLTSVSVSVSLLDRNLLSGSRYHLFIALYYRLPSLATCPGGGIGADGACWLDTQVRVENIGGADSPVGTTELYTSQALGWDNVTLTLNPGQAGTLTADVAHQCQQDLAEYGLDLGLSCTLTGIEIGTEGYGLNSLNTNWYGLRLAGPGPASLTASFLFYPSSPQTGQSMLFAAIVSGGVSPFTYSWDLGDGTSNAAASPSHIYSSSGSYTVKLVVTDGSGTVVSSSRSISVTVPRSSAVPVIVGWGGTRLDEIVTYDGTNPPSDVFPGEQASDQEIQVRHLASMGLNAFRVSFQSACTSWQENGAYNADWLNRSITVARHYNMWLIVDYHGYSDLDTSSSADCWLGFWAPVVQQFKNSYDELVWEPINEPTGFGDSNVPWLSLQYQRWIDQTRGSGDTHWTVVQNLCSYRCNLTNMADGYPTVNDTAGRVFISLHTYFFYDLCVSGVYGPSCTWDNSSADVWANKFYRAVLNGTTRTGWPSLNTEGGAVAFSTNSCSSNCAPDTVLSGDAGYSLTSLHFIQKLTSLYDSNQPGRVNWVWWPMGSWTNTPGAGLLGSLAPDGWGSLLQFRRAISASLPEDLNGDCLVNTTDVMIGAASFGKSSRDQGFDSLADINKDGIVNILDLASIALHYGQTC